VSIQQGFSLTNQSVSPDALPLPLGQTAEISFPLSAHFAHAIEVATDWYLMERRAAVLARGFKPWMQRIHR
jgi:hypothetical protein